MLVYPKKVADSKLIFRDVAQVIQWIGLLFLIPMFVGIIYSEPSWPIYLLLIAITSGSAYLIKNSFKKDEEPFTRLTVVTIAFTWVSCCIVGTLPFIFVGGMAPLDGLFESVSSISTAGLTTIDGIEATQHSVQFWRSFLAWLGGIGITAIAFYGVMQSESLSKIVLGEGYDRVKPSLVNSAKEIFRIYSLWTLLGIVLLIIIGTPVFDSVNLSMNAISTTGVDIHNDGWLYYQQTMPQTFGLMATIILLLMILGSISFIAHYRVIKNKRILAYFQDSETKAFFFVLIVGALITIAYTSVNSPQNTVSFAYEALSVSTTGGFELTPHITSLAGDFIMGVLIILALMGGSSNSAAGGLKIRRVYVMLRYVLWKAGQQISPKGTVSHFKLDGKTIEPEEVSDIAVYMVIYITAIIFVTTFMMAFNYDAADSFLTVASAQSGGGVSPIHGSELAAPIKIVLIGTMLFGRLEFIPMFAFGAYLLRRY